MSLVISNMLPICCSKSSLVKERTQASKSQFNSLPPHLPKLLWDCWPLIFLFNSQLQWQLWANARTNLRALACCSQHNREVPLKKMTTEQDHPGSAGAVSGSEPLQLVHLPMTSFVLCRGSWQHGLRLGEWTTNDSLEGQDKFLAMSAGHRAPRPCTRLPSQTRDHIV